MQHTPPFSGHSPTLGQSPITISGLNLKIQPGIKESLGLKESPQPALDVQQTGLSQNTPGRSEFGDTLSADETQTAGTSPTSVSPGHSSVRTAVANHVHAMREKQHNEKLMKKFSDDNCATSNSEKGDVTATTKPLKKPGSATPIAQLYPELAEKLERSRTKPEVKLKADVKTKVPKNSRTMNRLQTKIAQNKIKDKLRKSEKVNPLALPNALTKEVAPNVTITPEMSALQAQLLSALPPRHPVSRENKFPFASMGNMAPLMSKLSAGGGGGDANKLNNKHKRSGSQDNSKKSLHSSFPYPPGVVPNLDVTAAAATLAAAAAEAAAKSAAHKAGPGGDGLRSPGSSSSMRSGGVSPHRSPTSSFPYPVPATQPTVTSPRDSKCNIFQTAASVSSCASHSVMGLSPSHPAPHLMGHFPSPSPSSSTKRTHHHRSRHRATGSFSRQTVHISGQKRSGEVMCEREARCKLKRHSAVNFYAYHASHQMDTKDILPLGTWFL